MSLAQGIERRGVGTVLRRQLSGRSESYIRAPLRTFFDHPTMSTGHLDDLGDSVANFCAPVDVLATDAAVSPLTGHEVVSPLAPAIYQSAGRRRTPRKSLILVLPDNVSLALDELAQRLPVATYAVADMIVAYTGQYTDLNALQRAVGDAQFLLAPAGTSTADLRELAMKQAPGDIVTLLNGAALLAAPSAEQEQLQLS
jgi:hypothetical protein